MNKYTAVTIGPIVKTLSQVKSAKAIWAASYMFSYLIKKLIIKTGVEVNEVILPYFTADDLKTSTGVGLFPDRILFKKEIPDISVFINKVIDEFAIEIGKDVKRVEIKKVQSYIKDYIYFYHLHVKLEDNVNVIDELNTYLNTIELKKTIIVDADDDILYDFLENTYYNFLIKNEFDKNEQRFPSTIEIAMAEFKGRNTNLFNSLVKELFKKIKNEDDSENQQRFIDKIYEKAEFKPLKRNYHKYIAVIQADGDNVGSFIKNLYKEDKNDLLTEFSKNLMLFSKEAVKVVREYQGTPIYAGGDDLLFICPIAHIGDNGKITKSIFDLINDIDIIFNKYFNEHETFKGIIEKSERKPTMSYGISISYYKYPLSRTLEQGLNQLFGVAKQTCRKNAVSFAILKHSGQFIGTLFHKDNESYKLFNKIIHTYIEDIYIQSITYKLAPQKSVLYAIGLEKDVLNRNKKIDNFFDNNFNEDIHINYINGEKKLNDFLELVKAFIKAVYTENVIFEKKYSKEENEKNLNNIYAALRFVDFINADEER